MRLSFEADRVITGSYACQACQRRPPETAPWSGVHAAGASGATWVLWVDTPGRRGEESTFRHFA
jgi:hypothetical protein